MFYQLTMCALQIVFMIMIMIIMIVILTFEKRDTGDLTENFCFFSSPRHNADTNSNTKQREVCLRTSYRFSCQEGICKSIGIDIGIDTFRKYC